MKGKTNTRLLIMSIVSWVLLAQIPLGTAGVTREEKKLLKAIEGCYTSEISGELSGPVTLEEILRYGALRNAKLEAAFYAWKASVRAITKARSLDDPFFSFRTFIEEVETRVGPQRQVYGVSQKIPFPGKLYTKEQAATDVSRQHFAEYQKVKLALFHEIKQAFFEYWYLYKAIQVTEENQNLLEHFEGVAQSKFKANVASNQNLLKAQVELGKLANELLTLQESRLPIVARLNALLNRPLEAPLGWPEEADHRIIALDEQQLLRSLYENNPDLKRAEQRIKELQKKIRLARLDFLPDLVMGVDYINVDPGPLRVSDNGDDAVSLVFKVNVPLWLGKQKSQLDTAAAQKTAAVSERIQVQRDLESQFTMVYFKLSDAERQIKLYRDALVPKAEQTLKASETGYTAGNVDFLNLVDSQRVLLNFQLSYYRAIRDYEQNVAELEMIVGERLDGEKKAVE